MRYLDDADLATLRAEFASPKYRGMAARDRYEQLHLPEGTAPNPVATPPKVPAPVTEINLLSHLTDPANGSAAKLLAWPNLAMLDADIQAEDRGRISAWADRLSFPGVGIITAGEAASIKAYLASEVDDPAWAAEVPGPSPKERLFGPKVWKGADGSTVDFVTLADVTAAMGA